jgi:hypothetical protein
VRTADTHVNIYEQCRNIYLIEEAKEGFAQEVTSDRELRRYISVHQTDKILSMLEHVTQMPRPVG